MLRIDSRGNRLQLEAGRPVRELYRKHRWEMMVARTTVVAADMVKVVKFWIRCEGRAHSICQWMRWLQGVRPWHLGGWTWCSLSWERPGTAVGQVIARGQWGTDPVRCAHKASSLPSCKCMFPCLSEFCSTGTTQFPTPVLLSHVSRALYLLFPLPAKL